MGSNVPILHPDFWPVVSLKSICEKIGSGATPKGGQNAYLPQRVNYVLVRSRNVFDRHFDREGLAFISDEQAHGLRSVELETGDILLNITGDGITFSRSCIIPDEVLPACVNQHVSIIRLKKDTADPGFVLSYLTLPAVKTYIESFNAGGSRRAITKGHIESFQIPLPPIDIQKGISTFLHVIDKKIELNHQINTTLESMAQALFKSWFVDFDPVIDNALAAGAPIPEELHARFERRKKLKENPKNPHPPLPADIQQLFPSSFVFTEALGWVPEGWKISTIGGVVETTGGGTPSTKNSESGTRVYTLSVPQKICPSFRRGYFWILNAILLMRA